MILSSNGVRSQESNDLVGAESGVTHALEDLIGAVRGFGYGEIGSGLGVVGAACEEL